MLGCNCVGEQIFCLLDKSREHYSCPLWPAKGWLALVDRWCIYLMTVVKRRIPPQYNSSSCSTYLIELIKIFFWRLVWEWIIFFFSIINLKKHFMNCIKRVKISWSWNLLELITYVRWINIVFILLYNIIGVTHIG